MKNITQNKLLTTEEAVELLAKALEKFKDDEGQIDIVKAAAEIYSNPEPFKHQIKSVQDAVVAPIGCYHHYHLWEWVGLRTTRAFKRISD